MKNSTVGSFSAPTFEAFIETRIVRCGDAYDRGAVIAILCEVLEQISDDPDVLRLIDVARRRVG